MSDARENGLWPEMDGTMSCSNPALDGMSAPKDFDPLTCQPVAGDFGPLGATLDRTRVELKQARESLAELQAKHNQVEQLLSALVAERDQLRLERDEARKSRAA